MDRRHFCAVSAGAITATAAWASVVNATPNEFEETAKSYAISKYAYVRPVDFSGGVYVNLNQRCFFGLKSGPIVWPGQEASKPEVAFDYVFKDMESVPAGSRPDQFKEHGCLVQYTSIQRSFISPCHEQSQFLLAQKALSSRSLQAQLMLNNEDLWHVNTLGQWRGVAEISSSKAGWRDGTPENPIIKQSIDWGVKRIVKSSLATTRRRDLVLVVNPTTAIGMANSKEVRAIVSGSTNPEDLECNYGFPDTIYDISVAIEDTVIARASGQDWAMPDGAAFLLRKPVEPKRGVNLNTLTIFQHENRFSQRGELVELIDDVGVGLTATVNGFAFRNVFCE